MKVGVTFPQTEIGTDPGAIRAFAQSVEDLGFDHLLAYDHVLGADHTTRTEWRGAYNKSHQFLEPLVLFGFLGAVTSRIELATGVLVLSQRQTALVAKQAAVVDVLTGGRLRLAIGTGWNDVEYEALGQDFHNRGARSEEQIEVMRALWTQEVVTFEGRWHKITAAGINPLPVQRPIPVWVGGTVEAVFRRAGRIADGWVAIRYASTDERTAGIIERIRGYAKEAGRDPDDLGIEGRIDLAKLSIEEAVAQVEAWKGLGASHVSVVTMDAGFNSPDDHIEAVRRFKSALDG